MTISTIEKDRLELDSLIAEQQIDDNIDDTYDIPETTAELEGDVATDISETALSFYMNRITDSTPLSKDEEKELGRRIKEGDQKAFERLIYANLKFVIKVAYRFKNTGLPMSDIINQGNLGLVEAAKRYDPEKDVKFISYAVWWIRQYIVQGIAEQSGTVKLPIKQAGNLFKINNAREELTNINGKEPTGYEIAESLGMNMKDVEDIIRVSKQALSLENNVKDGEGKTFMDYMESNSKNAEELIIEDNIKSIVNGIVEELDTREKEIINMRFGFTNDETVYTLDEIGKRFGVSRELVRQIEVRAIDKLRKKAISKGIDAGFAY